MLNTEHIYFNTFVSCLNTTLKVPLRKEKFAEIEPRGAESRSILPRYVLKNGNTFECNVSIMWNPLYSHNWWTLLLPDRKVGDGGGPIVTVGDRTLY